jgi:hypothetical protein
MATRRLVHRHFLLSALIHRADLYIVLRKLVAQIQAFPQRIYEPAMVRFYSTVDPNDIVVIRQMICDGAFHVRPHPSLPRHWTKTELCSSAPDPGKPTPILVIIWI